MPWWLWVLDFLAGLGVLLLILAIGFAVRRRMLARSGGAFDVSIKRDSAHEARGWTVGLGRFREGNFEWFRVFSLSPRPRIRFARGELVVHGRRMPEGREAFALHAGHIVVVCESGVGVDQLAMGPDALTALLSWLESSPPGHSVNNVL